VTLGDFNGDGAADMLLFMDPATMPKIWYSGFYSGAGHHIGPAVPFNPGYAPQPAP
jgi:hypothetical protein